MLTRIRTSATSGQRGSNDDAVRRRGLGDGAAGLLGEKLRAAVEPWRKAAARRPQGDVELQGHEDLAAAGLQRASAARRQAIGNGAAGLFSVATGAQRRAAERRPHGGSELREREDLVAAPQRLAAARHPHSAGELQEREDPAAVRLRSTSASQRRAPGGGGGGKSVRSAATK